MHKNVLGSLVIVVSAVFLISCSTESNQPNYYRSSTDSSNLVASPTAVVSQSSSIVIYDKNNPLAEPAVDITTIKIDLYNEYGIRRQQAQINEILKEQACSAGGDAVVVIENSDKKYCYAKVVQTQPVINTAAPSTSTSVIPPESATKP